MARVVARVDEGAMRRVVARLGFSRSVTRRRKLRRERDASSVLAARVHDIVERVKVKSDCARIARARGLARGIEPSVRKCAAQTHALRFEKESRRLSWSRHQLTVRVLAMTHEGRAKHTITFMHRVCAITPKQGDVGRTETLKSSVSRRDDYHAAWFARGTKTR